MTITSDQIQIRTLTPGQPLRWLQRGWEDFKRAPWIGAAHGLVIGGFAFLLLLFAFHYFWLLAGAFTGFLVVAPVLAVGLYGVSRALERDEPAGFAVVWRTWMSWRGKPRHDWRLVRFSLLLGLAGSGWVMTSAALITLLSPEPVREPLDFLRHIVISREHYIFEIWLALGGALVAPVFASSVVTLPLLLDRRISVLDAVLTSWRAVMQNPVPMAIWAGLIMLTSLLGVLALLAGCAVVVPVLGHASWHAYRDVVDAGDLPLRVPESC